MTAARSLLFLVVVVALSWLAIFGGSSEALERRLAAIGIPATAAAATTLAAVSDAATAPAVASPPELAKAPTHNVSARVLKLRGSPELTAPVLGAYPKGTGVVVSKTSADWAKVTLPDGASGWMFGAYLTPVGG